MFDTFFAINTTFLLLLVCGAVFLRWRKRKVPNLPKNFLLLEFIFLSALVTQSLMRLIVYVHLYKETLYNPLPFGVSFSHLAWQSGGIAVGNILLMALIFLYTYGKKRQKRLLVTHIGSAPLTGEMVEQH
jgi:lipoprotein signal peptidase